MKKTTYTISIYTENNVGLLNRVSAIFLKRHINIVSITSSESEIPDIFRFVIVVNISKEQVVKVVKQIEKQIEVINPSTEEKCAIITLGSKEDVDIAVNSAKEAYNSWAFSTKEERIKLLGEDQSKEIEKRIFLQTIDLNWKSHIQYLEQLRQVIGLRSYGQRDPLVEYKKEAFELFSNLLEKLKLDYVTILMNLKVVMEPNNEEKNSKKINPSDNPKCLLLINKNQKISRNDRCEATGKKFKNCCGAL